ncbi:N-acetyltransferase family protein [Paenibacillus sp. SAF-068]|uniref:GNAT family N-acetyltransferase n=1 Tax=Paenibacillus sp. SAF-068 TaxID=3436864 RepID=UPI003F7DBF9E
MTMTNYHVRPIKEEDIPFLWEMLYASLHTREDDEPLPIESVHTPELSKYVKDWGREGDLGYIAVDQHDKRLGSITLRFYTDQNAGYGYVDAVTPEMGMAVTQDARGKGVGTLLLQTALDEVERRGIEAVSLSVDPDNQAIRLYRRLGFVEKDLCGTSVTMVRVSASKS